MRTEREACEKCEELLKELDKMEERLLNAFQVAKNRIYMGYLKYDEFKSLMELKRDHTGKIVQKED